MPAECQGNGSGNYTIPADNPHLATSGACDEIWANGVRNPWRSSFDKLTGDLFFGDVGQNAWEELDYQPANAGGGQNYGWRCYEGNHPYNSSGCGPFENYDPPIAEFESISNCSIIGGYVYRGFQFPAMYGHYLATDYCTGNFWDLIPDGSGGWQVREYHNLTTFGYVAFGQDVAGELYLANLSGTIYRLEENTPNAGFPWAAVSATIGTIPANGSQTLTVTFDSNGLAAGTYSGALSIRSSDAPVVSALLPLTLTVGQPAQSRWIGLWGVPFGNFSFSRGAVLVRDAGNFPIPNAAVTVTWQRPLGADVSQTAITNANGVTIFQMISAGSGNFTLTVTDISKPGYYFDNAGSVLSKTITVGVR